MSPLISSINWSIVPRLTLTPRTRALLPVHFAGRACDMEAMADLCERHDLKLIEDCAHAIETEAHGRKAGTFGDFGCFSFYVTKNVVTGEGGMVFTVTATAVGGQANDEDCETRPAASRYE